MSKLIKLLIFLVAFTASIHAAPKWQGSGGWGPRENFGRLFNPDTVETIGGEVTAIEELAPLDGMRHGIHLQVKTAAETVPVHLGPSWYLLNQDVQIRQGDKIQVTGSRVMIRDKPAIIASSVTKGTSVLTLRDDKGIPVWAGWRQSP